MTNIKKILFALISLNISYILLLDTSSLHGFLLPSVTQWTSILILPIVFVSYYVFTRTELKYEKFLYFSILLALLTSILRLFLYTTLTLIYPYLPLLIALSTLYAVFLLKDGSLRYYFYALIFATLIYLLNIIELNVVLTTLGPIFELAVLIAIVFFFIKNKPDKTEIIIIALLTIIGFAGGMIISTKDVAPLIIKTIFEQVIGVSQYSVGKFITTDIFFALHFAEILSLGVFMLLRKKSLKVFNIILTGFDLTFPPLAAFRGLAILMFVRDKQIK